MKHERAFLSERDSALLARDLRITDPTGLPGFAASLPDGVGLRAILFQYDATPPGGKGAGHKEHIPCAFGHGVKHWKGYGIELEDDRKALIGKDCGKKHFGLDFQTFENSFRAEASRQYELKRLIALREAVPMALVELQALLTHPSVKGYDDYFAAMRRHFGKMSRELAKSVRSSQGRLTTIEMVRDHKAEEAAARKRAEQQAEASDQPSLLHAIELAETAQERRTAVAQWQAFLQAQPPLWMAAPLDMGPCDAWTILNAAERSTPSALLAAAHAQAVPHARNIATRTSDQWTRKELMAMARGLEKVLDQIESAQSLVRELLAFASHDNVQRLAAWAQEIELMEGKLDQAVVADGRALVDEDTEVRLELPPGYVAAATPRIDAVRELITGRN